MVSDIQNVNKHVLLALGVDCTAKDATKVKFTRVPSMFPWYIGLVLPSLTRFQVNAVELAMVTYSTDTDRSQVYLLYTIAAT